VKSLGARFGHYFGCGQGKRQEIFGKKSKFGCEGAGGLLESFFHRNEKSSVYTELKIHSATHPCWLSV
jgi:hypothetical protein